MPLWVALSLAWAEDPEEPEEITVEGVSTPDTATGRSLDRDAILAFPAQSADELLRAMPGLQLSAHGGNGKAFQFLIRGFDAEHGSDLAVEVEGVPMNEPSNVHGQGYIDLHFLPTVLVSGLDLIKGSYRAADGDFAVTGSAAYRTGLVSRGLTMASTAGSDRSASGSVAYGPRDGDAGDFLVAEGEGAIGVGDGRRYSQLRAAAGVEGGGERVSARAMAFAYRGEFSSPGVLRFDDLAADRMDFYGAYPVSGGGRSARLLGIGTLSATGGGDGTRGLSAVSWIGGRSLALDQNFSGYLRDEQHGDGTRQAQRAGDTGARAAVWQLFPMLGETSALRTGADLRAALVSMSEDGTTPDGTVWEERIDSEARHVDGALWAEGRLLFGERLVLVPGMRVDRLNLSLLDRKDALFADIIQPDWANSGATVWSPKLTASVTPVETITLFGAAGRGFRSPSARGIQDGDRAPVVKSDSAEAGLALRPHDSLSVQATGFGIVLGNELVFDHLAGRFLSAGRTRRLGVEATADLRPEPWLHLQSDVTYTDGRFVADGTPIPYAPRLLAAAGVFLEGAPVAHGHLSGGLRMQLTGPRPLPDGFVSRPAAVGTLTSQISWTRTTLGLDIDNLLFGTWRDGEWVYPSWFDTTRPRSELKVLHVTAGDPFAVRLLLGLHL